jgi:hypothetical protein
VPAALAAFIIIEGVADLFAAKALLVTARGAQMDEAEMRTYLQQTLELQHPARRRLGAVMGQ